MARLMPQASPTATDTPKGLAARYGVQLANQALASLRELVNLQTRQVQLQESHPLAFRSQSAIHSSCIPTAEPVRVLDANPARKGLHVQSVGSHGAVLGLGVVPTTIPAPDVNGIPQRTGIFLGGFSSFVLNEWNGLVSGVVWTGELWAMLADPASPRASLTITEVR